MLFANIVTLLTFVPRESKHNTHVCVTSKGGRDRTVDAFSALLF